MKLGTDVLPSVVRSVWTVRQYLRQDRVRHIVSKILAIWFYSAVELPEWLSRDNLKGN